MKTLLLNAVCHSEKWAKCKTMWSQWHLLFWEEDASKTGFFMSEDWQPQLQINHGRHYYKSPNYKTGRGRSHQIRYTLSNFSDFPNMTSRRARTKKETFDHISVSLPANTKWIFPKADNCSFHQSQVSQPGPVRVMSQAKPFQLDLHRADPSHSWAGIPASTLPLLVLILHPSARSHFSRHKFDGATSLLIMLWEHFHHRCNKIQMPH